MREKGSLLLVEFEVEARAGGFDVGEARGGAGLVLGGGGGLDWEAWRRMLSRFHLPLERWTRLTLGSVKLMVENSMRRRQREADAERGADGVGADDGLGAEGGIFVDDEVLDGEAGEREEGEGDAVEVDGAAEALTDAGGDAALKAVDADQRRHEDEQQQRQAGRERRREAASERGAEDGVVVQRHSGAVLRWVGLSSAPLRAMDRVCCMDDVGRQTRVLESYRMT